MALYPVPVVCWTFLFGIIAGVSCCLIAGVSGDSTPVLFSTVGLHWVWFNCYIGLIAANTFVPMAARAGADVFSVLIGNMLARKTNRKAR
ncbi:MAG: hypothetical protein Q4C53_07395 [Clostridia bacterium]|nr:hypothetical protein [Clostridia bacterium]